MKPGTTPHIHSPMKETMDNEKLNQIEIGINRLLLDGTIPLGGAVIIDREESCAERLVLLTGKSAMTYIQRHCNIAEAVLKSLKLPRTAGADEVRTRLDTLLELIGKVSTPIEETKKKDEFWYRCNTCGHTQKNAHFAGTITCSACGEWCHNFDSAKEDLDLVWARCGNCGDAREISRKRMEEGAPPCCLNCMHRMVRSTRDTILLSHANCPACGWVSQTSKSRMHPSTHGMHTYKCPECGKLVAG